MGSYAVERFRDIREIKHLPTEELVSMLSFMRPNRDDAEWRREASWLQMTADGPFDAVIAGTQGEQELEKNLPRITPALPRPSGGPEGGRLASTTRWRSGRSPSCRTPRLVRFPGSSHTIAHDQPDAFVAAVKAFLA